MLCPKCHRESSDITNTCVWCGATLDLSGSPSDPSVQQPQASGVETFQDHGAAGRPVSEWPSTDAGHRPPQPRVKHWYLAPWPYAAAILIVVAVLSFFLLRGNRGGAGAFPELVLGNRPTLLNIYTDT